MRFPEGFKPPSEEAMRRVLNPRTFVIALWNGVPADNSGRRSVMYLTDYVHPWHQINRWTPWRSEAAQFDCEDAANAAHKRIVLDHLRERAKVYNNCEVHMQTGGLPGKELT